MIMAALLKWKEPRAVADYELQHEGIPEFKNLFRLFGKWSFILGMPVLVVTWRWLPEGFFPVLYSLLICGIALLALFCFQVWVSCKVGVRCTIDKKGITRVFGNEAHRYTWKEIENYQFVDYLHAPNVRVLIITVRRRKRQFERHLRFTPPHVSEQKIAELLRQYLHHGQ
jgi:hypothetical protein